MNDQEDLRRIDGSGRLERWRPCLVPLLLVLSSALALATPPDPQAAYQLPGDDQPLPAVGDQTAPAIARGGDQYLAVWTDERTAYLAGDGDAGSQRDIYAARLDADGALIDTTPIVVTQGRHDQFDPVVSWNGHDWLVLWTDSEPYGPLYTHFVQGARVSPAGVVLDAEPILIRSGGTTGSTYGDHLFGLASDGTDWAVVFADEYVDGLGTKVRLEARLVTANGLVTDAGTHLFSPACCYFFYHGGLAYSDGVYMAVFEGYVDSFNYGIFGLRFSSSLDNLDSYPLELVRISMQSETHFYRTPNVAAGDGMFYVGWQLYISDTSSQVYGARVGTDGVSLDGDGVPISATLPLSLDLSPDVAWDGSQWILAWPQDGLTLARVDAAGNVLDPGGVNLGLETGEFAAATGGGLNLVRAVASGVSATPSDVFETPISASLVPGDDICLSLGAPAQIGADLATGTSSALLVYRRDTSAGSSIMAHPLDEYGEATLPEPVPLTQGELSRPGVAFDGTRYLVVWGDQAAGEVRGRRLDEAGELIDLVPFAILDGDEPDVTARDGEFFVTASQPDGIHGARVSGDGTVVDAPSLLLGAGANLGPASAPLGDYYLTVWEATGQADGSEIAMSLVTGSGTVIGPLDVTQPGDGLAHFRPAVAAGDTALIVWEDERAADADLYGRRVTASATFLDPATGFAIVDAAGDQRQAATAWDGVQFLDVFSDDRNAVDEIDLRTDVYRNWVTRIGLVEDPSGIGLFADPVPEIEPAVAGRGGNALYAASRFTADAPHAAYRIWLRFAGVPTAADDVPRATGLLALYPNPANPAVTVRFRLGHAGEARIDVHDLQGARVRVLRAGELPAGEHAVQWDGRDDLGRDLPSGTYLFRLRSGQVSETGKVTLVR